MPRVRKPKQQQQQEPDAEADVAADETVETSPPPAPQTASPKSANNNAAAAPVPATATTAAPMTLLLRLADRIEFRRVTEVPNGGGYDAAAAAAEPLSGGDFRECEPVFSDSGDKLACSNGKQVFVLSAATAKPIAVIDEPNITQVLFSPSGRQLVTFRLQDAKNPGEGNMAIWSLASGTTPSATAVKAGFSLLLRCGQSTWPAVWWTRDESFLVRRAHGHLLQVHDGSLAEGKKDVIATLDLETPRGKEPQFAAAHSDLPFLAFFVPQIKSSMGYCKIVRLPNVKDEMLMRSFGNADDATLSWSPYLNALLVLCRADTDKTGGSYYGRTTLTVMNLKERNSFNVVLGKDDSIHDSRWSPTADEFIVVHGQMPRNKATLFNALAQPIYSFGEAPRNYVQWAPDGRMFILGGNGNLAGETQFYAREAVAKKGDGKLGFFSEKSSISVWTPDSRAVISANVFTRLRLDNKLTFFKHTGAKSYHEKFDQLYSVIFMPVDPKTVKPRAPSPVVVSQEASKPQAYRPPGAATSGAAAILARRPGSAVGGAVKPATAGPVGANLVVDPKKKGGRR